MAVKKIENKKRKLFAMIFIIAMMICFSPFSTPAYAQLCDQASTAENNYNNTIIDNFKDHIRDFITQEKNFNREKLWWTARLETVARLTEFDDNIRPYLAEWWTEHFHPAWKQMSRQLHFARVDQTLAIGRLLDAEMANEVMLAIQSEHLKAIKRYKPSELSCQIDTVAMGQGAIQQMSRSLARTYGLADQPRQGNAVGSPNGAARGVAAETAAHWEEYVDHFCDPALGDVGCTVAGDMPGENRDFADVLWGDKLSIDMENADTRFLHEAAMRYLLSPRTNDPVLSSVVDQPQGPKALLIRHAKQGRLNAAYNVLGRLLADRAEGSGINTQDYRVNSGIQPVDASVDASYREIMEAMGRDRFHDPNYIAQMVNEPEQLIREQSSINAMRLQQIHDLYSRLEEMVFLEAAVYADTLDQKIPSMSSTYMPK